MVCRIRPGWFAELSQDCVGMVAELDCKGWFVSFKDIVGDD